MRRLETGFKPLSLLKAFQRETIGNMQPLKRLQNKIEHIRAINLSGILKKKFPFLVHMRVNLRNAMRVIMCCVVLHNILITWKERTERDSRIVRDFVPPMDHIDEYEEVDQERSS